MTSRSEYDAIVIGSGIGALAFASIMAKLRKWRYSCWSATTSCTSSTRSCRKPRSFGAGRKRPCDSEMHRTEFSKLPRNTTQILIVLGVRDAAGRLGAATHLERTTAHKVVAHATCPVLTVRG